MKSLSLKTAIFAIAVLNLFTAINIEQLHAQQPELLTVNNLVGSTYYGEDQLHRRSRCTLTVGPELRDSFGRIYRDFTVKVDTPGLSYPIRTLNPGRTYSPDSRPDATKLVFLIALDGYRLKLTTSNTATNEILEFALEDVRGVTGHPGTLVNCTNVRH